MQHFPEREDFHPRRCRSKRSRVPRRAEQGITQVELASLCGVGVRFVSELENGKSTAELGKVQQVLKCLGLELSVRRRGWGAPPDNS